MIAVVAIAILFLISFFGEKRGWYKRKGNWFSRIMHFLGGFFVAMFWFGLLRDIGYPSIILLTFLVGIFWEMVEYFYGIYKFKKLGTRDYMTEMRDTVEDLICDILGATVWLLLSYI